MFEEQQEDQDVRSKIRERVVEDGGWDGSEGDVGWGGGMLLGRSSRNSGGV